MGKDMSAKFRTIRNLRGYNDAEKGFPPSEVDDSEYEDINDLVKRFLRGETPKVSRPFHYDGAESPEALMERQSPFEKDGSDLSDVGPIQTALKERQKAAKAEKGKKPTSKNEQKGAKEPVSDPGKGESTPPSEKPPKEAPAAPKEPLE